MDRRHVFAIVFLCIGVASLAYIYLDNLTRITSRKTMRVQTILIRQEINSCKNWLALRNDHEALFPTKRRATSSSATCISGYSTPFIGSFSRDWLKAQCLFSNMFWSGGANGTFVFVIGDDENQRLAWDFDDVEWPYVVRKPSESQLELVFDKRVPIRVMNFSELRSRFPEATTCTKEPDDIAHIAIFSLPRSPRANPGHFLGDNIWPTYNGVFAFRLFSPNNQILVNFNTTISEYAGVRPFAGFEYLSALSTIPPREIKSYGPTWFPWIVGSRGERRLFAGHEQVQPPFDSALHAAAFRDIARYVVLNTTTNNNNTVPRITIVDKQSPLHKFLNVDDIISQLKSRFPSADVRKLDFRNEIEQLLKTHVFITPNGGVSFGAIYLPDGASAIFGPVCFPCKSEPKTYEKILEKWANFSGKRTCCRSMDSSVWSKMSHFHKFFLRLDPDFRLKHRVGNESISENMAAFRYSNPFGRPYDPRLWSFDIEFDTLEPLVREALMLAGFQSESGERS